MFFFTIFLLVRINGKKYFESPQSAESISDLLSYSIDISPAVRSRAGLLLSFVLKTEKAATEKYHTTPQAQTPISILELNAPGS